MSYHDTTVNSPAVFKFFEFKKCGVKHSPYGLKL